MNQPQQVPSIPTQPLTDAARKQGQELLAEQRQQTQWKPMGALRTGPVTHNAFLQSQRLGYFAGIDPAHTEITHMENHNAFQDVMYLKSADLSGAFLITHTGLYNTESIEIWLWNASGELIHYLEASDTPESLVPYPSDPEPVAYTLAHVDLEHFTITQAALDREGDPMRSALFRQLSLLSQAAGRWQSLTTPEQQKTLRACLKRNRQWNPELIDDAFQYPALY